ncbi:MAG: outer membrane protein assembly factor BamE [Gemmatimonadales bacterium]
MTWRHTALLALCCTTLACDRLPFLGGGDSADTTTTPAPAVAETPPAPARTPAPAPRPAARVAMVDEPWTPVDTGTITPGMTRDEVVALWGTPEVERMMGDRGYLYFRNGCEVTCGTYDVVFLEFGQVVDVIARGEGHSYAGTSSSPVGRTAAPTLPAPMITPDMTVNSTP